MEKKICKEIQICLVCGHIKPEDEKWNIEVLGMCQKCLFLYHKEA